MRKGQGSLEYLLILAAVLAIAVVVVVVANQMLAPAQEGTDVAGNKYTCSLEGIEFEGYSSFVDNAADAQTQIRAIKYQGEAAGSIATSQQTYDLLATCKIGRNDAVTVDVYDNAGAVVAAIY